MGAHRSHRHSYLHALDRGIANRPGLVLHPGRHLPSDSLAIAAGALSAYYIKGVVPEWSLEDIYAGMMQFMVIQVIGLLLVLAFPFIVLWLPEVLFRGG